MPTSAKTPDRRSDRYLGTSERAPRLRHICRVGSAPTAPLRAIRRLRSTSSISTSTCTDRRRPSALRRTLHTGAGFLTEKQRTRLEAVFAVEEHVEVEATWGVYQRTIAAYRDLDEAKGKKLMQ
ncbi:hypothetical protein CG723_12915 [Streptomyces sp. CB01635]|nr:hypothetical protein CG723_12915 [Streptomyces sp. CB01635]